jgi:tripartite-type tricarboxylate transporter receptor subunit TctC
VPTLAELGIPQATVSVWYSLLGPARMPPAVAERLRKEVASALADPTVRAKLEKLGSTVTPLNSGGATCDRPSGDACSPPPRTR